MDILEIMFFYEQGQSSLHLHKLHDKSIDVIFLWDYRPHFIHHLGMYRLKGMTGIYNIYGEKIL